MTRTPDNPRHASQYIQNFHAISGLACNLDKTHVIPVGMKTDPKDILWPELGMEWSSSFTILRFNIDNRLKALDKNYTNVFAKIKGIIKK